MICKTVEHTGTLETGLSGREPSMFDSLSTFTTQVLRLFSLWIAPQWSEVCRWSVPCDFPSLRSRWSTPDNLPASQCLCRMRPLALVATLSASLLKHQHATWLTLISFVHEAIEQSIYILRHSTPGRTCVSGAAHKCSVFGATVILIYYIL